MTRSATPTTVYTVGHSTRSLEEFVEVLASASIACVVDVRRLPKSRRNPDFDLDRLPGLLRARAIGHEYVAELGGRRGRSRQIEPPVNGLWENPGFHNYADYAMTAEFEAGLARLLAIAAERRSAIMCSEAVWWRCHRRIVADHLLARGHAVIHLMSATQHTPASITKGAVVEGGCVRYPEPDTPR